MNHICGQGPIQWDENIEEILDEFMNAIGDDTEIKGLEVDAQFLEERRDFSERVKGIAAENFNLLAAYVNRKAERGLFKKIGDSLLNAVMWGERIC